MIRLKRLAFTLNHLGVLHRQAAFAFSNALTMQNASTFSQNALIAETESEENLTIARKRASLCYALMQNVK